ncbi:MAG: tRNA lysidine(34) synthetase TilS [Bosea sp. (in: a-proteobacteria)]
MNVSGSLAVVPLTDVEADACLALLGGTVPLLAVSGGADSVALMSIAAEWALRRRAPLHVAVVDHGLRDGSAQEAAFVMAEAGRLSLSCTVLRWDGPKPKAGLQKSARAARYTLLVNHAREIGADAIVTAHTLDDQAETLMMRLAAGTGPAGMAGMRLRTMSKGMLHLRPFLGIPKDRLIATCQSKGWRWTEDPSNRNAAFTRVRWRALMPLLAREGLTARRLEVFARRMADNELALQQSSDAALQRAGLNRHGDGWQLEASALFAEPDALVVRALACVLHVDAQDSENAFDAHGPRLRRIEACVAAMRLALRDRAVLTRTLGGQMLTLKRNGLLVGVPEPMRRRGCVNPVRRQSLGNGLPEN